MKKLIKKVINALKREKIDLDSIEKIDFESLEESIKPPSSGRIVIDYDSQTGDFQVESQIDDLSNDSVEILALLIFHITKGDLESFIFESLRIWADDEDEKIDFNVKVALQTQKLDSMIIDETKVKEKNKVAVSASQVFNFRENLK